jgi:hypothetical protein
MLNITLKQETSVVAIVLDGRLDSLGAVSFDREVKSLPADCLFAVIDMTKAAFLISAGIRSLFYFHSILS